MKFLALIAARGGSKRIPRKNLRHLGGKPLINWSIDLASRIDAEVDIVVSTDDPEIADVACAAGALVPRLRPSHLSDDAASSIDVVLYELEYFESTRHSVDGVILLQPTSPFRRLSTVVDGIRMFQQAAGSAIVGLSPASSHPAWCFKIRDGVLARYNDESDMPSRSQDLPPAFQVSGGLYIISPQQLRAERTFFPRNSIPIVTEDEAEALDIDTEWDWLCAEQALSLGMVSE
jgi:CMP-N,N'-diacetyllegionaminic acid synthase